MVADIEDKVLRIVDADPHHEHLAMDAGQRQEVNMMTTDRALKQDVRARMAKAGESYSTASRWIEESKGFPRFIAARPQSNGGRRFHALRLPAPTQENRIIFWGRSLCGLRAQDSMGGGGWRGLIPADLPEGIETIPNVNGFHDYIAFDPDVEMPKGRLARRVHTCSASSSCRTTSGKSSAQPAARSSP
ncbi:hypothetical protein GCM10025867_47080 (plasmid) [Frondihabitans sucicola]|uniref:Uncharacterized protein n=1 Tax=Frondihabitans sucicola TaxID=1268041 RepID=A0ABM8GVG9_9MICO|nr:hypothetical protein [Frondihabitans sucicola]BDZ52467.1 hypothetical protein GCM10025867_47080 [Frondihabitans sucicola]